MQILENDSTVISLPAGMIERHLIEELASIIWCKRRVFLADPESL